MMDTKIKQIFFLLLFSLSQVFSFSQKTSLNCDIKNLKKKFKKSKVQIAKADYALDIADCFRLSNDTNYLKWYQNVIQTHKKDRICDGLDRWETKPYLQIGLSYYWLENYLQSAIWLEKAIIAKEENTYSSATHKYETDQALYLCGKSYYNIEDFQKAKSYFIKYQKIKGDTLDVNLLIQKCN